MKSMNLMERRRRRMNKGRRAGDEKGWEGERGKG